MSDFESKFDSFLNEANAEFARAPKAQREEKRYPCPTCAGTGQYHGVRVHQAKGHCFACRGKGYFTQSPKQREANKVRYAQKKADAAKAVQVAIAEFQAQQPEMFAELSLARKMASYGESSNAFILSLADQLFARGTLSERQIAAWYRGKEKLAAIRAEKEAARKAAAVAIDLSPIAQMFEAAMANGYKKPMYRANGLRIKPGREGALYVMTEERMEFGTYGEQPGYEGKIAAGQFHPVKACAPDTADKLKAIAADPLGEAIRHGRRTGHCSCCGRELTNHASIDAGIGPICASKWGLGR